MENAPDPHGDFVIAPEATRAVSVEQGDDHPIGQDELDPAHRTGSAAASESVDVEPTADTIQSVVLPLSVRFGTQEAGA
jgi:hypothetical protein